MLVFKEKKNVSNMGDIYLKRNDMSTTFLQQILSGRLLLGFFLKITIKHILNLAVYFISNLKF